MSYGPVPEAVATEMASTVSPVRNAVSGTG